MIVAIVVSALYVAVIGLVLAAGRRAPSPRLWSRLALVLAALLIERLVEVRVDGDLGGLVRAAGWYGQRRPVQAIVLIAIAGLLAIAALRIGRVLSGQARVAALATLALAAVAMVRAVSLHQVDAVLGAGVGPVRVRHLLEFAALATIAAAAWRARLEAASATIGSS